MCIVEGNVDEAVAQTLASCTGFSAAQVYVKGGRAKIAAKVRDYFRTAGRHPWFVLVDLDGDPCPSGLLRSWSVFSHAPSFVCRVAVREIEAWLLADRERFAHFLKVSPATLPAALPEDVAVPKRFIVELAARSRSREIQSDMQPTVRSKRREGPAYSSRLREFIGSYWRPHEARAQSQSLDSCMTRLEELSTSFSPLVLPVPKHVRGLKKVLA